MLWWLLSAALILAGLATWVGIIIGMIAKVALAFVIVGVFIAALLL